MVSRTERGSFWPSKSNWAVLEDTVSSENPVTLTPFTYTMAVSSKESLPISLFIDESLDADTFTVVRKKYAGTMPSPPRVLRRTAEAL